MHIHAFDKRQGNEVIMFFPLSTKLFPICLETLAAGRVTSTMFPSIDRQLSISDKLFTRVDFQPK